MQYLSPSADWLSVSFPADSHSLVSSSVREVLAVVPGVAAFPNGEGWCFPSGGLVQFRNAHSSRVWVLSASGAAIAGLRAAEVFGDYLRALGSESHRVTRLDVALDVRVSAPPRLAALYARAVRGEVSLSRKSLNPGRHVSRYLSPGSDGQDTGTVYLGGRSAEVTARVYDKRQECLARGLADPGPWLRAELTVRSAVGPSLRDAWEPVPLFWHFMASALEGIVEPPTGVSGWTAGGIGFSLPACPVRDSTQVLRRRLEQSAELGDLVALARSVRGGSVLFHRSTRRLGLAPPSLGFVPDFPLPAANDPCW